MLQLWIENDGRTAHLVNEAGGKVVSGHLIPPDGVADLVKASGAGQSIECPLIFQGVTL